MITAVSRFSPQRFQQNPKQSTKNDKLSFGISRKNKLTYGAYAAVSSYFGGAADAFARTNNMYHLDIPPIIMNIADSALIAGGIVGLIILLHKVFFGKNNKGTPA